jgi:hypothetical protein
VPGKVADGSLPDVEDSVKIVVDGSPSLPVTLAVFCVPVCSKELVDVAEGSLEEDCETTVVDGIPSLPVTLNVSGVPICNSADVVDSTLVKIEVTPCTVVLVGTTVPLAGEITAALPITVLASVDGVAEDESDTPAPSAVVEAIMGVLELDGVLVISVEVAVARVEVSTTPRDQYRLETTMSVDLPLDETPVFSSTMESDEELAVEETLASVAAITAPYKSMHAEARGGTHSCPAAPLPLVSSRKEWRM